MARPGAGTRRRTTTTTTEELSNVSSKQSVIDQIYFHICFHSFYGSALLTFQRLQPSEHLPAISSSDDVKTRPTNAVGQGLQPRAS